MPSNGGVARLDCVLEVLDVVSGCREIGGVRSVHLSFISIDHWVTYRHAENLAALPNNYRSRRTVSPAEETSRSVAAGDGGGGPLVRSFQVPLPRGETMDGPASASAQSLI